MVSITSSDKEESKPRSIKKRVVLVLGRQTPGDGPVSYVVQGFFRHT